MSIPRTPLNSPIRKSKSMNDMTHASDSSLMKWPSLNESIFAKCAPSQPLIRTPEKYTATHSTDPPPQQVLSSTPLHSLLRALFRTADSKMKRDVSDVPLERPTKVLRTA